MFKSGQVELWWGLEMDCPFIWDLRRVGPNKRGPKGDSNDVKGDKVSYRCSISDFAQDLTFMDQPDQNLPILGSLLQ